MDGPHDQPQLQAAPPAPKSMEEVTGAGSNTPVRLVDAYFASRKPEESASSQQVPFRAIVHPRVAERTQELHTNIAYDEQESSKDSSEPVVEVLDDLAGLKDTPWRLDWSLLYPPDSNKNC